MEYANYVEKTTKVNSQRVYVFLACLDPHLDRVIVVFLLPYHFQTYILLMLWFVLRFIV